MSETQKLEYFTHSLKNTFISKRPFYIFWIPINIKCYKKLKESVGN